MDKMNLARRSINIDLMKCKYHLKMSKPIDKPTKKIKFKKQKKSNKENFLNMLRGLDVYIKGDITKEKEVKKEIIPERIKEEITPKKKIFKHENPINRLKEVHNEI